MSAGIHKVNLSLHSFEEGTEEDYLRYVGELAEFSKKAAEQGTIVVFRLWNKGFDGGKNAVALKALSEFIPGDWAEIKGTKFFCYGLKDQFGILVDGTVVPCCLDSDGVLNLGNIFTEDLNAILASPRAAAMVAGFRCGKASEELCRKCGYAQRFV